MRSSSTSRRCWRHPAQRGCLELGCVRAGPVQIFVFAPAFRSGCNQNFNSLAAAGSGPALCSCFRCPDGTDPDGGASVLGRLVALRSVAISNAEEPTSFPLELLAQMSRTAYPRWQA